MTTLTKTGLIAACAGVLASCAGMSSAQQTLIVETPEPGAEVYLEVEGVALREMKVPGIISGTISERSFVRDFGYLGTTPLTYTVPTYGETRHVSLPGQFRSGEERYARSGLLRVVHADGFVEERRFAVRNGETTLSFAGAPDDDKAQEAGSEAR